MSARLSGDRLHRPVSETKRLRHNDAEEGEAGPVSQVPNDPRVRGLAGFRVRLLFNDSYIIYSGEALAL